MHWVQSADCLAESKKETAMLEAWLFYLGFLDEPLPALGAGNGDLSFSSGDTHHLTALGAVIIAMIPVLQAIEKLQKFTVFLIALVGIAGKGAIQGPEHQRVGNCCQQQVDRRGMEEATDHAHHKTRTKDRRIKFIGSVAAHHEISESIAQPL